MNDRNGSDVSKLDIERLDLLAEIETWLRYQPIDTTDLLFRGSATLAIRGIRRQGDVDVGISQSHYRSVDDTRLPERVSLSPICYDNINLDVETVISNRRYHDLVDGYKVVRPEIPYVRKHVMDRIKDHMDRVTLHTYAINNPDDWSWQLVGELEEADDSGPRLLLQKFVRELGNEGLRPTLQATRRYATTRVADTVDPLELESIHHRLPVLGTGTDLERYAETNDIHALVGDVLERGFTNGRFSRYDIVVQAMAIEEMVGTDTSSVAFEKVSELLQRDGLSNPKWGQNLRHRPARLSVDGTVRDSVPVAKAIALGRDTVQITVESTTGTDDSETYDETWLEEQFTTQEVREILDYWNRIQSTYGLYYYVLVWPYAVDHLETVETELATTFDVGTASTHSVDIFYSFVRQVFSIRTNRAPVDIDLAFESIDEPAETVGVFTVESIGRDTADVLAATDEAVRRTCWSEREIEPAQFVFTTETITENQCVSTLVADTVPRGE